MGKWHPITGALQEGAMLTLAADFLEVSRRYLSLKGGVERLMMSGRT